jgi:hypothetical protein
MKMMTGFVASKLRTLTMVTKIDVGLADVGASIS